MNADISSIEEQAKDPYWGTRWHIAVYTKTPKKVLKDLSKDPNCKVRVGVAENPNTPKRVQESLAEDKNWQVLHSLSLNKDITKSCLKKLAINNFATIRAIVSKHPKADNEIKEIVENTNKLHKYIE